MPQNLAALLRAITPGGLLLLLALLVPTTPAGASVVALLRAYPVLLFGTGALLALVFHRGRALAVLLAFTLANLILLGHGRADAPDDPLALYAAAAVGLLIPANLALAALLPERSPLSASGMFRLAAVAAQGGVAAYVWLAYWPGLIELVQRPIVARRLPWAATLPQPAFVAFVVGAIVILVQLLRKPTPHEGALLAGLVAVLGALVGDRSDDALLFMAAAGLAQVAAVVSLAARSASVDGLTGLPGRRAFDERLAELGSEYVVAIADIDHFKRVNDVHGHGVGDQVLRMIASRLAEVGGGGKAYRIGGEEFALIFPGKSLAHVKPYLEAVREAVAALPFVLRDADRPRKKPVEPKRSTAPRRGFAVTISIGAAERGGRLADSSAVMRAADAALYRAKNGGRNRVWC